jgi:hypothetical protein
MLDVLLRLLGFDLQQKISQLKSHLEEFKEQAVLQVKQDIKTTGIAMGLVLAGGLAGFMAFAIAMIALYLWVDMHEGPFVALAVVGTLTVLIAVALFTLAVASGKRNPSPGPLRQAAGAVPPSSASVPPESATTKPTNLSDFVSPPPQNASILDLMAHRVTTRAAAASDEAINAATEVLRTGSREAVLGTLALAALVGVLVGRRR